MELGISPARTILTTLVLTALISGCTPEDRDINANPNAGTLQDQYNTLLKRPNIEQATHKYKQLLEEIKTELQKSFNLPRWEYSDNTPMDESGCGFDFPDIRSDQGVSRSISGGFTRDKLTGEQWDKAVETVTQIANRYGFKGPERVANNPQNRSYNYFDATGARFSWGQIKYMSVSVSTGCHLTPEAHERGGPPASG